MHGRCSQAAITALLTSEQLNGVDFDYDWLKRRHATWVGEKTSLAPNLGVGYAYFSGGTIEDFFTGDIKTFQRMVSDRQYGEIIDRAPFGTYLSNSHIGQVKLGLPWTLKTHLTKLQQKHVVKTCPK